MQVTPTTFTIAEYVDQMREGKIVVNKSYQRSSKIWPAPARSYLIDTILSGYPVPKMFLSQTTDLKSRKTIKEIVDGQQRSRTIEMFFQDELRVAGKSEYTGKKYSELEEADQLRFLNYPLSVDLFSAATAAEIRQVFRRINAYSVPLNNEEKRHAHFQGSFKWYMHCLSEKYAQTLKDIGVFTEPQLTRMADIKLLSEIIMAWCDGMVSSSGPLIDKFYDRYDVTVPHRDLLNDLIDTTFSKILQWYEIHETPHVKVYNFFTLFVALMHHLKPSPALGSIYQTKGVKSFDDVIVLGNLGLMLDAIAHPQKHPRLDEYVKATLKTTDRVKPRSERFRYYCMALEPGSI